MLNKILILMITLVVSGCSSTYQHTDLQSLAIKLDPNRGVLISVPDDGLYETKQYHNSGQMTANAVRAAFVKNARMVNIAKDCRDIECLDKIDVEKYGYFVMPVILHWEDRATEWSGIPDRIEIQLIIFDTVSKKELANSSYIGKSKWATLGGDHPQDLLPEPTNDYVSSLYK